MINTALPIGKSFAKLFKYIILDIVYSKMHVDSNLNNVSFNGEGK